MPGEHSARSPVHARGVGACHSPQEEIQDAGEITARVVVRKAPAQVSVEGYGVEQRLEDVVGALHLGGEGTRAVVPGGQVRARWGQPIGLVVDDGEARSAPGAVHTRNEVYAPGQVSADAAPQGGI